VPSMHRKRSSGGRRSCIHRRGTGGVPRQIQAFLSSESPVAIAKMVITPASQMKDKRLWSRHTYVPNCAVNAEIGNLGRCRLRSKSVRPEFESLFHSEVFAEGSAA
jgi:hypothetical protein